MSQAPLTNFRTSEERLATLKGCIAPFPELDPSATRFDWVSNMLSLRTVVYESGRIARSGEDVRHNVDPAELESCRTLAAAAKSRVNGNEGLSSEHAIQWLEFLITANIDETPVDRITGELVRERFNGTILPIATVKTQPLTEAGKWFEIIHQTASSTLETDAADRDLEPEAWTEQVLEATRPRAANWPAVMLNQSPPGEEFDEETASAERFLPWLCLIKFFQGPEFKDAAFVEIGDSMTYEREPKSTWPPGMESWPTHLPRLFLGLTNAGSLTGLFGYIVQT